VTPGAHPAYAHYLIRRIRVATNSPLLKVCRDHGYHVELARLADGSDDPNTAVVSFPFSYPEGTTVADDMTAIDQLEVVRRLQREWSDNAVSCTVYYKPEELPAIKEYLSKHYTDNFKTLSFLLHSGHGFEQAPLEPITKQEHEFLVALTRPITSVAQAEFSSEDECVSGACPIK
jgi:hypothetical protein